MPDTSLVGGVFTSPRATGEKPRFSRLRERVALVHDLLEQRQGDVSESEMAALFGCSERQARRVFHYVTGESFRCAQVRTRLIAARALVRYSITPISQISEHFGYSRRAKFDQSYESVFGITPAADRAGSKKRESLKMATQGVDTGFAQVYRAAPRTERREEL
jgi:transcriptional regulator GlxA family with amidase domain